MTPSTDTSPPNTGTTNTTKTQSKKPKYSEWTRLNHKGIYHDNRRLLKHRAKNCECFVCYREIYKLPPMETSRESAAIIKNKITEREIKKAKRVAKKEVKTGKQGRMDQFFPQLG